jgi:hypothetical protein
MSFKKMMLAVTCVAMLAAVVASSASAAAVTGGQWYVKNVTLPVGTSKAVKCHIATGGTFVLTGEIGETTKTAVEIKATGIDCLNATISNSTTSGVTVGTDAGELQFTGVTVVKPANCSVEGGTITTKPLKSELYSESTETNTVYDKFEPVTVGGNFATIPITGASCSVAGNRVVKGSVFGRATNKKGVMALEQPLNFSSAIDTAAGSALTFAANPAHLTGSVVNELNPAEEFGSK